MMRRLVFILPLIVMLMLCIGLFLMLIHGKQPNETPLLGKMLPAFHLPVIASENGASSREMTEAGFKGKLVWVNIFASWCGSCQIEHPLLMKMAKAKLFPIYGIAWKDKDAATLTWLKDRGNPYTAVLADRDGRFGIDLGITGAPESFLLNGEGKVIYHIAGPITERQLKEELLPLLEEAGHAPR